MVQSSARTIVCSLVVIGLSAFAASGANAAPDAGSSDSSPVDAVKQACDTVKKGTAVATDVSSAIHSIGGLFGKKPPKVDPTPDTAVPCTSAGGTSGGVAGKGDTGKLDTGKVDSGKLDTGKDTGKGDKSTTAPHAGSLTSHLGDTVKGLTTGGAHAKNPVKTVTSAVGAKTKASPLPKK